MPVGMDRLTGPMRCMAFLASATESVHPPVRRPSYRGADRSDMATGSGSPGLDFGPDSQLCCLRSRSHPDELGRPHTDPAPNVPYGRSEADSTRKLPLAYSRRKEAGQNPPIGSMRALARMGIERGLRPLNERALVRTACSRSTPVGL
ncbi:hypothetical protein NDU88_002855 [Pleurodeles waltl]|uniref:Uncharacterized protein n=1 Tax=Pleurodeles waltl TaxID=8319 RepID=A0AAV7LGW2_PLEWA|nr:hypothetical protein NDU88_002855 [Pleurodeles waltl]